MTDQLEKLLLLEAENAELKRVLKAQVVAACNDRIAALEEAARKVHKEAKEIMAIVPNSTELDGSSGIRVCNVEDLFEAKQAANRIVKHLAEILEKRI